MHWLNLGYNIWLLRFFNHSCDETRFHSNKEFLEQLKYQMTHPGGYLTSWVINYYHEEIIIINEV